MNYESAMKYQVNFSEQEKDELLIFMHAEAFRDAINEYFEHIENFIKDDIYETRVVNRSKMAKELSGVLFSILTDKHLDRFFNDCSKQ